MQLKNEEAPAAVGRSGEGGYEACTRDTTSRKQKRNHESEAAKLARDKFVWRGLSLHLGRSSKPLLTVVPDVAYPHLFRIPTFGRMDERAAESHQSARCRVWARSLFAGGGNARRGLLQPRR